MFLKSTYNEILKIASKPRSYIGIAAITLIISVILLAMWLDGITYISFITAPFEQSLSFTGNILNGNLMAFIILNMLIIHVPLLIAFVTGDLISGEGAMGTIRATDKTNFTYRNIAFKIPGRLFLYAGGFTMDGHTFHLRKQIFIWPR